MRTMPTCSPFGPTNLTSGTRMRSLMRVSTVMWPPQSCYRRDRAAGTLPPPAPMGHPRTPRGPARIVTCGARRSDRSTPRVGCQHATSTPEPRLGIPGPDPAALRRFGWERAPLATSAGAEAGRTDRVTDPHRSQTPWDSVQRQLSQRRRWPGETAARSRAGR